jgi:hypothetical protein
MEDGVRTVIGDLEHDPILVSSARGRGAIQVAGRIPQQARLGSCTIRPALEGVKNRQLSIPSEFEHGPAPGSRRLRTQGSAGLGHAVEVSIGIRNQRSKRLAAIRAAAEGKEHVQRAGGIQPEHASATKLAVAVSAEQGRAKDVPGIVHADPSGRNPCVAAKPSLELEQQVFLTLRREFEHDTGTAWSALSR